MENTEKKILRVVITNDETQEEKHYLLVKVSEDDQRLKLVDINDDRFLSFDDIEHFTGFIDACARLSEELQKADTFIGLCNSVDMDKNDMKEMFEKVFKDWTYFDKP